MQTDWKQPLAKSLCRRQIFACKWQSKWLLVFAICATSTSAISDDARNSIHGLIGKILPALPDGRVGILADWIQKGGTVLDSTDLGLNLSEYYRNGDAIFIVTKMKSNRDQVITASAILPTNIMNYRIIKNTLIFRKNAENGYSLEPYCKSDTNAKSIIVGLARSEKKFVNCSHWSGQLSAAWAIDKKTGEARKISPKGITCLMADFEDSCEQVQPEK
ncbi:MAG: hypothetical protein Q8Q78_13710 [Hydrogenophaga sp.]|nr:hypothetical protein [Hydrogenophaga sp.]